jgi:hypothetical protein
MAFTDFTLDSVLDKFELIPERTQLFADLEPVQPSAWLVESLRRSALMAFTSEKSRSEFIIAPILIEAREATGEIFSIYSGQRLEADASTGLVGECDFIFAKTPYIFVLRAPIVSVVEAKKQDVELGLGQCAAQLVASRQFNQKHDSYFEQLYGCVTTGEVWQFLLLEGNKLKLDTKRYSLDELPEILGVFQRILETYL